jgi:hypothetical protein
MLSRNFRRQLRLEPNRKTERLSIAETGYIQTRIGYVLQGYEGLIDVHFTRVASYRIAGRM